MGGNSNAEEKKSKITKTKKAVKKTSATKTSSAAMLPASFELAPNHPEKRYPGNDGKTDILCRWIDGQGTVCKPVRKGGGWDDG
jgi:hypothetical protein